MTFEEFIVNKDGSFLISRKIKGKSYEFGVYPTLEEAQKECERLDDNGWPIRINKPKYQDFYNPPKIDSKEIKNLEKFNNLILLKISVKLNKSINKWYVELVYHSNIFKIGLFINQIETEAFINKFLINGSVTKETILTILDYESIDDFKKESKLEVLYDINEDKYNLQLINKDQILTLGSYFVENQANNVKKDYLEYLNKISCFKKIDKERFIHFADENISYYNNLEIGQINEIISDGYKLPLNFQELIDLIDDFKNSHLTVLQLSEKYKIPGSVIKKIIYNEESGKFEGVLKEYNEKLESLDFEEFASDLINMGNDEDSYNKNTNLSNDVKSYTNLSLKNNGKVFAGNNPLKIKVYEIEDLYDSFKKGSSIKNLSKHYDIEEYLIKKIIHTYQNGNFDDVINEWNNEFKSEESTYSQNPFEDSIRSRLEISDESSNQPYKSLRVNKYGNLEAENRNLGFTIFDARNIHEDYNAGEEIKDIIKKHNFTENKINRIILRYDAGDFHKVLKKMLKKNPSNEHTPIKIKNNIPFTNLETDTNGNIIIHSSNSNQNISLGLKIKDIILLFNEYKKNRSIKSLSNHFNMGYASTERIINRIITGDFKEIIKLNPNLKLNEEKNNSQSTKSKDKHVESPEKNNSSNNFADEVTEYVSDLSLKSNEKISSGSYTLPLKIYEIEELYSSFKKGITVEKLSKQFNVSEYIIKKTIYNYELGKFDGVITEWKHEKIPAEPVEIKNGFNDPIRERIILSKSNDQPYKILKVSTQGILKGHYNELKFTILDARDIHESYNEGQSIENLAIKYKLSNLTILRIIGRYDAGDFDKFLKEMLIKNLFIKDTNLKIKNNLPFDLGMDAEGNIYNIESNGTPNLIGFNLKDIKLISEEYGNNRSIKSLSNHFNMNYDVMERIINRIIVGDFKKIPQIKREYFDKIPTLNENADSSKFKEKTGKLNEINEKINFILNYYDNILEESKNSEITKKSKSEELNKKTGKLNNQNDIRPNLSNETIHKSKKPLIIKDEKPAETLTLNNNEESEVTFNNFKEINELKDQIEKLNKSNKEKTDVIDHLILENQQNSSVYAQKIKDLNNSLEDFDQLTIKVNMLKEENLNLKTNNTEKSHKIEGLIKEKNEYLLERTNTNNDLNDSLAKYNQLNSEVKDLKSEISNLTEVNVEKSNQIEDLVIMNKKSSEEYYQKISNLNDSLAEYGHIKSENEDLKQVIKTKSEELKKLVENNKKSEQTYTQKIEDLKSSIVNQEQNNDLKSEINILKSENANLKTFNKNKSQELELEKSKIKKINNKLQNIEKEYNNKIYDLKDFSNELLTENEKLKFELQSKPKDKLNSEIESLKLKIKDMKNVYNRNIELNNEIYDLKKGQASLINYNNADKLNHLKGQISKTNLELNSLKKSNKELLSENMKLKSVLKSKPEDESKSEIESLKLQIKHLKTVYNENKKLNKEIKELKKGKNSLKGYNTIEHSNNNSYENLKDQLSKAKTELTELNKGSNQLNKDIKKLTNEKKILQDEKDKIIQSYNEENNLLKDTLSINKSKLQDLQKSNQQLIDENEKLKSVNNVEGQNKNNFESKNNSKNDKKNLSKDLEKVDDFIYKFINGKIEKIKKH